VVRSDAYVLDGDVRLQLAAPRTAAPLVDLDGEHYKLVPDFDARFPEGPPSLREAERLKVTGDVRFGAGVVVRGAVSVDGPADVAPGTVLEG
jgi:UTP--glucose-1-phosphate uridylyltransferase